jgi:hypothetical protein
MLINFDLLAFFSTIEAKARPSALKVLKSSRTKVVPNECPHFFRLQLSSIFEFEIFPYKNASAYWIGAPHTQNLDIFKSLEQTQE